MKLSIDDFGGNKDNYYNCEREIKRAKESLSLASLYVNPFFKESKLGNLNEKLESLRETLSEIEFVD